MIIKFRSAKYDKKAHGGYIAGADYVLSLIISTAVIVTTVGEITATFTVKVAKVAVTVKTPGASSTVKIPRATFTV